MSNCDVLKTRMALEADHGIQHLQIHDGMDERFFPHLNTI